MPDPVTRPAPVTVGLGRSNVVVTVAVFAFLCLVVWKSGHGAYTSTGTSARVLGYGLAGLFGIPLVMLLFAAPRFLSPRRLVFDTTGLTITHGKRFVSVPWAEISAIGISYEQAAQEQAKLPTSTDEITDIVKHLAADKVGEALHISGNRRLTLEFYPTAPDAATRYPRLKPYWKAAPPPVPGLPPFGWRFPLPPVVSIAGSAAQAAQMFVPRAWLGWYARPWSG